MSVKQWWAFSVLALVAAGCDADSNNSGSAPSGTLPCNGLAIDCRMAFKGDYDGSYAGSATGTFTLYVDMLGGIQGSGVGVATITGQVDEFGRIQFSFPDGSEFKGQFNSDRHSFSGTWSASGGKSGTFSGRNATVASGTGGSGNNGGTGGTGNNSSTGGTGNTGNTGSTGTDTSTPSVNTVMAAAESACQIMASCGIFEATDCPKAQGQTEPSLVKPCWDEELVVYQCVINAGCAAKTQCETVSTVAEACENAALTGGLTGGTEQEPTTTSSKSLNEAVIGCQLCLPDAKTCFNSLDCRDFAYCLDACAIGDANCTNRCTDANPTGDYYYFVAYNCQKWDCGA